MYWCHKYTTKGRFPINQILFRSSSILQVLPKNHVSPKLTDINLIINDIPIEQALGILWNLETDTFHIKYTVKSVLATKWGILSLISFIVDSFGFIAPTLSSKWTLQRKNSLGPISTFTSYKTRAKITRKSTRHTKYHFRQIARVNGH